VTDNKPKPVALASGDQAESMDVRVCGGRGVGGDDVHASDECRAGPWLRGLNMQFRTTTAAPRTFDCSRSGGMVEVFGHQELVEGKGVFFNTLGVMK
jgi:hypothetical protein